MADEQPQEVVLTLSTLPLDNGFWGWRLRVDSDDRTDVLESGPDFGTEHHAAHALRALVRIIVNGPADIAATTVTGWTKGSRPQPVRIPILTEPIQGD